MPRRRARPGDPLRAVAYLRASTREQKISPEAQRAAIEAWSWQAGASVAGWHVDAGVSGGAPLEHRPALLAALAALREHGAGVLVVARRDRLARDVAIALAVEHAAASSGAVVVSAAGEGSGQSAVDALLRVLLDGVAAYERALIRTRTRAALAALKAQGRRVGGVPLGWRVAGGGLLEHDPGEQRVIARMRELRASGLSYRAIAEQLGAEGPAPRSGRRWHETQVQRAIARTG